jgi:hypothetical protein
MQAQMMTMLVMTASQLVVALLCLCQPWTRQGNKAKAALQEGLEGVSCTSMLACGARLGPTTSLLVRDMLLLA